MMHKETAYDHDWKSLTEDDDFDRTREPRWGACFYPRIDERDLFRLPYPDPLPGDYPDICIAAKELE